MVPLETIPEKAANERPRGKPRGIKDCNSQELRSKPRILHMNQM
jgi:hypothetical protein